MLSSLRLLARPRLSPLLARGYRGGSGEPVVRTMSEAELTLSAKSADLDKIIREKHVAMPTKEGIPEDSLKGSGDSLDVRKKRLIYRAKQRGWLEVDLLLGTWAHRNVPGLDEKGLDSFEKLVNLETIDIYNIITLREPLPKEMEDETTRGIMKWVETNPLGAASPEEYKKVKNETGLS